MVRTKVPMRHGNPSDDESSPPAEQDALRRRPSRPRPKLAIVPAQKKTEKQKLTADEKRKSALGPSPMDKRPRSPVLSSSPALSSPSSTDSDSFRIEMNRTVETATNIGSEVTSGPVHKKPRTGTGPSSSRQPETTQIPSTQTHSAPQVSTRFPFLNADIDTGVNTVEFNLQFRDRPMSRAMHVDFDSLKNDLKINLDLRPYLGTFECLLKIREPYSPEVVRRFYANMRVYDEDLITQLRGREIKITKDLLNQYLNAPLAEKESEMSVAEAQTILLKSDKPVEIAKEFFPSRMCNLYRVIHYIYSRSILNKAFNFTYLSHEDCILLAKIIRREKLDVGKIIVEQMKRFTAKRYTSPIPFPQLASLILQKHNIQHLEGSSSKTIPSFGSRQFGRMGIELPFDHLQGVITPTDKGKETASEAQPKAQSGSRVPQGSFFINTAIQSVIQKEFGKINQKVESVRKEVADFRSEVQTSLRSMKYEVDDIKKLVLQLVTSLGPSLTVDDFELSDSDDATEVPVPQPVDPSTNPATSSQPPDAPDDPAT